MPKAPTPSHAVETAYQHLDDLESVLQVFETTSKAIESCIGRLSLQNQHALKQLGLTPTTIKGNLVLLTHIVHGIEVMHRGTVALSAEECSALTKAPLVFKRCVGTLAALSKPQKPRFLEFLLNKQVIEQSTSTLSMLTELSDLFSRPFCDALQHFDDDFALRKGHVTQESAQMILQLVQKTDALQ